MSIGLLEAFELSESFGDKALTIDELLFMADARKRKGCRNSKSTLTTEERRRVLMLGLQCKKLKGKDHG